MLFHNPQPFSSTALTQLTKAGANWKEWSRQQQNRYQQQTTTEHAGQEKTQPCPKPTLTRMQA